MKTKRAGSTLLRTMRTTRLSEPLAAAGAHLRFRLEGLEPEAERHLRAYLRLLLRLPCPGQKVRLPDGRIGTVQEVLRHACYGLEPPDWGWRVVVRLEGGRPYEDVSIAPSQLEALNH